MNGAALARASAVPASAWGILVRLAVGLVFLPEGIQKLVFPALLGSGRFARIGIPWPDVLGPFVGSVEIVCGLLILLGLLTRLAAVPLVITMVVAIVSTKIPILLGRDWWMFHVADLPRYGWWSFLHETRTDWAMLMGALYLLAAGAGGWSLDALLAGRRLQGRPRVASKEDPG
ncbi:MAG TPA: DoxX family protein [Gammaproteobacteria bacterium]|nr:DoxX family protein [Gammaproteobacteria bacterium]